MKPPNPNGYSRPEIDAAARERWQGAALRFRGLGKLMLAERELRNIRLNTDGYQVVLKRDDGTHYFSFNGFSEKSLRAAKRYRDELLRMMPSKHGLRIPPEVLDELGLSEPVIGVSHCPQRSCFRVALFPRSVMRNFYYRQVSQADAYAAAIEFREEVLAQKLAQKHGVKV